MDNRKTLIVNADDFGQSAGITQGIIMAHTQGIVTSTSLMVRYDHAATAVEMAAGYPELSLGLHLDLGEWKLVNGEWLPLYQVVSSDDHRQIEEEINRQVDLFMKLSKRQPTHIDSHQHVHMKEQVKPIISRIAEELKIPLRHCTEKIKYCGKFYGQDEHGNTYNELISEQGLIRILSDLDDGITELACHPAFITDIDTMYKKQRQTELKSLCSPAVKDFLNKNNIRLCSFADMNHN